MATNTPRVLWVSRTEVDFVLERLPAEFKDRLREIHLFDGGKGSRLAGYVAGRARREININVGFPARVSLWRYMHAGITTSEFGAPPRGQWPPWAVRRFILYDVALHELGHTQEVAAEKSSPKKRFAGEAKAREFALRWRRELWSRPLAHPDIVHNEPSDAELAFIPVWERLDKESRLRLVHQVLERRRLSPAELAYLGPLTDEQARFVRGAFRMV